MTKTVSIALCAATGIGDDLEWLHLLPAGGVVRTNDGRGPYRIADYDALMAASLKDGDRLVLDENHSTDLAAPKGLPAPARGWIVALQRRDDGIWGKVEWTPEGRELAERKHYRGISPVIAHRKDGTVVGIRRASLVNQPNLEGLTSLHSEGSDDMDLRGKLAKALGLGEDADDDAIVAAVERALGVTTEAAQAALAPIAKAVGLAEDAGADEVLTSVTALAAAKPEGDLVALQAELTQTASALQALQEQVGKDKATAFVDGAIAAGHVGVKPLRERYISMHMSDPTGTEELVKALPVVKGAGIGMRDPKDQRSGDLDEADRGVIALMGLDPEAYKKTRQAEAGVTEEAL